MEAKKETFLHTQKRSQACQSRTVTGLGGVYVCVVGESVLRCPQIQGSGCSCQVEKERGTQVPGSLWLNQL